MEARKKIFLLYYLAAGILLGGIVLSCASGPRPLRLDDGLIAYVGEDGNIHVADIWGADRLLTSDAGASESGLRAYAFPAWAPNEREIAFVRYDSKTDGSVESSLAAYDYAGVLKNSFFSSSAESPFYLYWSPAGDRIGFLANEGRRMNFRIAARDGESRVAGTGSPFYWTWSPDGRNVVTHEGEPASRRGSRLRVVDAAGAGAGVDVPFQAALFQAPAFSPDGRYFAAAGIGPGGAASLLLAGRDGGSGFVSIAAVRGVVVFDWSPRGGRLAYVDGIPTPFGTVGPLKVVDVDRPVFTVSHTAEPENVAAFFWSPEGRRIAYFEPRFSETERGGRLLLSLSVIDTDTNTSKHILTFQPSASFLGQIVPFYGQYQKSAAIWSPDGKNVVVNAVTEEGREAVVAVNTAGEWEPWFVGYGTFPFWSRL